MSLASAGRVASIAAFLALGAATGRVIAQDAADVSPALSALSEAEPLTFSGSMTGGAAGAVGWPQNPIRTAFGGTTVAGGATLENSLDLDARLNKDIRVHGSVSASFPKYSVIVEEIFFDWSIGDLVFLRCGKQDIGWGDSKIFDVGDLMEYPVLDSSGKLAEAALSIKAYMPFGTHGLTLAGSSGGDVASGAGIATDRLSAAGRLDFAFRGFELSEEALCLGNGRLSYSSSVRTSALGVDLTMQAFGSIDIAGMGSPSLSALAGAYWESSEPRVKAYAEYWYDGAEGAPAVDHRAALSLGWNPSAVSGLKLGISWVHAFADGSGSVTGLLVYQPLKYFSLSAAAIATYGADGSIYASRLPPAFAISELSWGEKYTLALMAEIALDY
jgi:hypothetical protein